MQPLIIIGLLIVAVGLYFVFLFALRCYRECEAQKEELDSLRDANLNLLAKYHNLQRENAFLKDENTCLHIANDQQKGYIQELNEFIEDMEVVPFVLKHVRHCERN